MHHHSGGLHKGARHMALRLVKLRHISVAQTTPAAWHSDFGGHWPQGNLRDGTGHSKGSMVRSMGPPSGLPSAVQDLQWAAA